MNLNFQQLSADVQTKLLHARKKRGEWESAIRGLEKDEEASVSFAC